MLTEQAAYAAIVTPKPFGLPGAFNATRDTGPSEAPAWQVDAVAEYALETETHETPLRTEFAARIYGLTGCSISSSAITVNSEARRATAILDGVVFHLSGHNLIIMRPCSHCGVGRFESPPLGSRADLGFALIGWRPYHADCEPTDSTDGEADY